MTKRLQNIILSGNSYSLTTFNETFVQRSVEVLHKGQKRKVGSPIIDTTLDLCQSSMIGGSYSLMVHSNRSFSPSDVIFGCDTVVQKLFSFRSVTFN